MDLLSIINLLSALFTIIFAVFTGFKIFHRHSIQHRIDRIREKMVPLIVGKTPKQQILDSLKKEGFPEDELQELYDVFNSEYAQSRTQ